MQVEIKTTIHPYGLLRASANVTRNPFYARDTTGDEEPFCFEEMRTLDAQGKNVAFELSQEEHDSICDALATEFVEALEEIAERKFEREEFYA